MFTFISRYAINDTAGVITLDGAVISTDYVVDRDGTVNTPAGALRCVECSACLFVFWGHSCAPTSIVCKACVSAARRAYIADSARRRAVASEPTGTPSGNLSDLTNVGTGVSLRDVDALLSAHARPAHTVAHCANVEEEFRLIGRWLEGLNVADVRGTFLGHPGGAVGALLSTLADFEEAEEYVAPNTQRATVADIVGCVRAMLLDNPLPAAPVGA